MVYACWAVLVLLEITATSVLHLDRPCPYGVAMHPKRATGCDC